MGLDITMTLRFLRSVTHETIDYNNKHPITRSVRVLDSYSLERPLIRAEYLNRRGLQAESE